MDPRVAWKTPMLAACLLAVFLAGCQTEPPAEAATPAAAPAAARVASVAFETWGSEDRGYCTSGACVFVGGRLPEPYELGRNETVVRLDLQAEWASVQPDTTGAFRVTCSEAQTRRACTPEGLLGEATGPSPLRVNVSDLRVPAGSIIRVDLQVKGAVPVVDGTLAIFSAEYEHHFHGVLGVQRVPGAPGNDTAPDGAAPAGR